MVSETCPSEAGGWIKLFSFASVFIFLLLPSLYRQYPSDLTHTILFVPVWHLWHTMPVMHQVKWISDTVTMISLSLFLLETAQGFKIHRTVCTYRLQLKTAAGYSEVYLLHSSACSYCGAREDGSFCSLLCSGEDKGILVWWMGLWEEKFENISKSRKAGSQGPCTSNLAFWKNCNVFTPSAVCEWSEAQWPTA